MLCNCFWTSPETERQILFHVLCVLPCGVMPPGPAQVEGVAEQVGVEHPRKLISFTLTGELSCLSLDIFIFV